MHMILSTSNFSTRSLVLWRAIFDVKVVLLSLPDCNIVITHSSDRCQLSLLNTEIGKERERNKG
jgi:hypothetical protein